MEPVKSSSSISSSIGFVASAAIPTEEIFLVDSLDDCATAVADEICRFIEQGFGTSELDPIEGHVRPFYLRFRKGS
jgi:hypothetical protein